MDSAAADKGGGGFDGVDWHGSKKLPVWGQFPTTPLGGFGAAGNVTLWVPTAKAETTFQFVDGEPRKVVEASPLMRDEALLALRDDVAATLAGGGAKRGPTGLPVVTIDVTFYKYAAAVLRKVYALDDAEMSYLLAGQKWMAGMITHLCGGPGFLEALFDAEDVLGRAVPAIGQKRREAEAGMEDAMAALRAVDAPEDAAETPREAFWSWGMAAVVVATAFGLVAFGIVLGLSMSRAGGK